MPIRIIILCGGYGTRLWPESRKNFPKQFIPIFKERSLLDLTLERLLCFKNQVKPIIICNKKHCFYVKNSLKNYNVDADILLEPEGKDTTAAIYLASRFCFKDDNLIIMPSDHLISDNLQFVKDVMSIINDPEFNCWFTLGVKPTKASEAYGYIKVQSNIDNNFFKVLKFIEKPSKKIAEKLIDKKNYFWNSGIFIGKASTILNSIKVHAKHISDACDNVFLAKTQLENSNEINFPPNLFKKIPSKSIDFSVMEYEKNIKLLPLNSKWSDVGSWDALSEINYTINENKYLIQINSKNNFVRNDKRVIATIGIEDLIIVDNDNGTLIAKKGCSEKVKLVVDKLIKENLTQGQEHTFEERPWGRFETLLDDQNCKVKRIEVSPNSRLSLQYHNFRSEHWLIAYGKANIHLDGKNLTLNVGESIDIPVKSHHFIENTTDDKLIIIETQLGTYFGEDDIIRLDDPYNR